jgi:hypothetical protein
MAVARVNRGKKVGHGRILAAMMADFQNVCMQVGFAVFRSHGALDIFLGVTGQEHGSTAVAKAKDEGVLFLGDGATSVGGAAGRKNLPSAPSQPNVCPRNSCSAASWSASQPHQSFDMERLRKKVEDVYLGNFITHSAWCARCITCCFLC